MYSILFHVAGIAIIEICFYFIYIGPIESSIFEDKIKHLIYIPNQDENIQNIYNSIQYFLNESTKNLKYNNNESLKNYLLQQSNKGLELRNTKNQELFYQSIKYWLYFTLFSIFIFLIYYYNYKKYLIKKKNGTTNILSQQNFINYDSDLDDEMEMINLTLYRKNSIDDEQIEQLKYCSKNNKKNIYNILYYLMFTCSLIGFQYLFFKFIVSKYIPLSNDELRYIIYKDYESLL